MWSQEGNLVFRACSRVRFRLYDPSMSKKAS